MKKVFCVTALILAFVCALSSCNQSYSPSVETTATTLGETTIVTLEETTPEVTTPEETTPEETTPETTLPEKNTVYVKEIKCESITLLRETPVVVEKHKEPEEYEPVEFRFEFIQAPEGTSYTTDPESLANNPNRVRIDYEILPHTASNPKVLFDCENEYLLDQVFFDEETNTFVFLKRRKIIQVTIKATDGSGEAIKIRILAY